MAASYPGTIKTFSTKVPGEKIASSHINDLQDEVVAVETQLGVNAGTWQSWSPTYSEATLVTAGGTFSMRYSVIGKTVFIRIRAWNCTVSSGGNYIGISLPITPIANPDVNSLIVFKGTASLCGLDSANTVLKVFSSIDLGSFTGSETSIDFSIDLTYEAA